MALLGFVFVFQTNRTWMSHEPWMTSIYTQKKSVIIIVLKNSMSQDDR